MSFYTKMKPSSSYNFLIMSNVYDVEDLKAQIRQLRSTRSALQQESEVLEKEIASLQVRLYLHVIIYLKVDETFMFILKLFLFCL